MLDKLPLWAIRSYENIWEDEQFKYIQTHKSRYVLDILNITGNYWDRRLKSLDLILPYKLYPINKRFEFLDQVVSHKNRWFIDDSGTLINYKPTRFVKLKTDRIIAKWGARNGDVMFKVHNCPRTFRSKQDTSDEFLTYVKDGNKFYMYKFSSENKEDTRKKI